MKLLRAWEAHSIATTRDASKQSVLATLANYMVVCADADTLANGVAAYSEGFDLALDPMGEAFTRRPGPSWQSRRFVVMNPLRESGSVADHLADS